MNPIGGVTDDPVDNGKAKTMATTAPLIRNPYASATTRQRPNQQLVVVTQFPLEQLDLSSSLSFRKSSTTAAQSLGRINENKKDPPLVQDNNNNNLNSNIVSEPPPPEALQVVAAKTSTGSTATATTTTSSTLNNIESNIPQWQRLPSRTCSFESAEILTVTEACRHAALYQDKSIRITGIVVFMNEKQISSVNASAATTSSSTDELSSSFFMMQKEGYRSFLLADPLASPLQQTSLAAGELSSKAMPAQMSRQPQTTAAVRLSSSTGGFLRKQQHPFKPRQQQQQQSSSTTTTSSFNSRLGRPFRVPVLRRPVAATQQQPASAAAAAATATARNEAPPQQPLPPQQNSFNIHGSRYINQHSSAMSTAATTRSPFGNNNKRPASQISTTAAATATTKTPLSRKQPATAAATQHNNNNKICVWFHPDQVPIMQALKMGDLVMVIGEIRQVTTATNLSSSSNAAVSGVVSGSIPQQQQQYVLVARICTNANGTNMKLHHQALLVRRRHLLRNSSSSSSRSRMVVTNSPYKLQKPSSNDAAKEGDTKVVLRPGCGPPPYSDF